MSDNANLMIGAAFLTLIIAAISGLVAVDETDWIKDERGCYLRVEQDRRVWWSETDSKIIRKTYCPEVSK